jgi:hypothetical protein
MVRCSSVAAGDRLSPHATPWRAGRTQDPREAPNLEAARVLSFLEVATYSAKLAPVVFTNRRRVAASDSADFSPAAVPSQRIRMERPALEINRSTRICSSEEKWARVMITLRSIFNRGWLNLGNRVFYTHMYDPFYRFRE